MSSPSIQFASIPSTYRKPGIYSEFNIKSANRSLPANLLRVVLVGQMMAAGASLPNVAAQMFSDDQAAVAFGAGSMLHRMVMFGLATNPNVPIFGIGVADAVSSAAAAQTVTFAGTPTAAGTFSIFINGDRVDVGVLTTSTPTALAAGLVALIAGLPNLPVTAANVAGVATLTAKNKGTMGNTIKLRVVATAATGATCTLGGAKLAGGATDPDSTSCYTAISTAGYEMLAAGFIDSANIAAMNNYVDFVATPVEERWTRGWIGSDASVGTSQTLAGTVGRGFIGLAAARGSERAVWEIAASAAVDDASQDDPAMPLDYDRLSPITPSPNVSDVYLRSEQEALLHNGVTPLVPTNDGQAMQIVRAVSTYTVNVLGTPDPSLLDMTTMKSMIYTAIAVDTAQEAMFPGKFTARTPKDNDTIKYLTAKKLEKLNILRNVDDYKDEFFSEGDSQNVNQLDSRMPVPVVPGLHIIANRFDLILTNGTNL